MNLNSRQDPPTMHTFYTVDLAADGTPIAWVVGISPSRDHPGTCLLTVSCPLCGGWHLHGGGDDRRGELLLGHRVAHCVDNSTALEGGSRGYVLRLPDEDIEQRVITERAQCQALARSGSRCKRRIPRDRVGPARCGQHRH